MDRSYFFELGAYDDGLLIWGGENFELSFKVDKPHACTSLCRHHIILSYNSYNTYTSTVPPH